jgi:hypothetical protein
LIKRLLTAGFIERDQPSRGLLGPVRLSPAGLAKFGRAAQVAIAAQTAALSSISTAEQQHVTSILQTLLGGLDSS